MRQVFRTIIVLAAMTVMAGQPAWADSVTVNNWAELSSAINDGAVIELGGDDVYYPEGSGISIDAGTVTIDGKGHTIDAYRLNAHIFEVNDGATLILKNLTLKNTFGVSCPHCQTINGPKDTKCSNCKEPLNATSSDIDGGAIYINGGTLRITSCTFTNNYAISEKGGAIYNHQGTLKIVDSKFEKNATYDKSIYNDAADEDNLFKLTILNTTMIEDKVAVNFEGKERKLDDIRDISLLTTEYEITLQELFYAGTDGTATVPVSVTVDPDYNGIDSVKITNTIYTGIFYHHNGEGNVSLNLDVNRYTARFKLLISLTEEAFENDDTKPYKEINFKVVTDSSFTALEDKISKAVNNTVTLDKNYIYDSKTDNHYIWIDDHKTVTIDGNGHRIDGNTNNGDALFLIEHESDVTLKNITLMNGHARSRSHLGEQVRMGGAIFVSRSTLNLINATLKNNTAAGNNGCGGAIYSDFSTLNIIGTTFTDNIAVNGKNLYVQGGNGVSISRSNICQADIYNEPDWDNEDALAPITILPVTMTVASNDPFDCMTLADAIETASEYYDPEHPDVVPTLTLYDDIVLSDNEDYNSLNNYDPEIEDSIIISDGKKEMALMLDLNGHKITSSSSECVLKVNCKMTITDSAENGGGAIDNTNAWCNSDSPAIKIGSTGDLTVSGGSISGNFGIDNTSGGTLMVTGGSISGTSQGSGIGINNIGVVNQQNEVTAISTVTITGGSISGSDYGIANRHGGNLTLTGGTIESTGSHAIDLNGATLTIGSGVTLKYPGGNGISNSSSTIVMTGVPTFVYTGTNTGYDIYLGNEAITFADNFTYTKPSQPIMLLGVDLSTIFTSGYSTHCVYPEGHAKAGQTVDPNELFIDGNNDEGEYAELDATSGEVRFNTPFNVTIALVDPTKNVNQTDILYCGTLKSAIDKVAEYTTRAKQYNVELTSSIIQPQKDYQISDADLTNGTVEFGDDENAIVATLDLNGHTISGTAYEYLITVAEKSTLTVAGDGAIGDINYWYGLIDNNGTLNITGGTFDNGCYFTNNGTMTVSDGTFTSIYNFGGSLTVSGGTFNVYDNGCAIYNLTFGESPVLTLSALPTFVHPDNATNCIDIYLEENMVINFDKAITTFPTTPITVKVKNAAPYVFTSGYGTYVKDTDGEVIDPASMFTVTADNSLLDNAVLGIHASEAALFTTETVTFPVGKTTYYSDKGLKLTGKNENLKFYTVTNVDGTEVEVTEITGKTFGKQTPLIVSNESNAAIDAVMVEPFDEDEDAYFAALCATDLDEQPVFSGFKGTAVNIDEIGMEYGKSYFGFTGHDFVKISEDGPVKAHRCWLEIGGSNNNARRLNIIWTEETTRIDNLTLSLSEGEGAWFTIDGRKLSGQPTVKGVYIINGKKMVVK